MKWESLKVKYLFSLSISWLSNYKFYIVCTCFAFFSREEWDKGETDRDTGITNYTDEIKK